MSAARNNSDGRHERAEAERPALPEYRVLVTRIRDAFHATEYPGDENILEFPLDDPECESEPAQVRRAMRGKRWEDVGLELLAEMWEIPGWLSPIAFRYYLPALLIASAEDLVEVGDSMIPQILWGRLTPPPLGIGPPPEEFCELYRGLTEQQIGAVRACIHFIVTHFRWERGDRDERALMRRYWWAEQSWWDEQVRMGDLSSFNSSPTLNALDAQEYPAQPPDGALLAELAQSDGPRINDTRHSSILDRLIRKRDHRFTIRSLASNSNMRVVDALAPFLGDEDRLTRDFAAIAMGKAKDVRALDPLITILLEGNREAVIRWMAADALGVLGDRRSLAPLHQTLKERDEDDTVRARSAEALARFNDRSALPLLIDCLADPKPEVVLSCALALGIIGDPAALPALQELANRSPTPNPSGPIAGIARDAMDAIHSSRDLRQA